MHLAESLAEYEMYAGRRGPLFDWLKGQRDMADCAGRTPVQQARQCGLLGDEFPCGACQLSRRSRHRGAGRIGFQRRPLSAKPRLFRPPPFPCQKLCRAGVNVCLGTDSLASVLVTRRAKPELNMFAEMRAFAAAHPDFPPETIVRMATQHGARALGRERQVGALFGQALADLITIPFGGKMEDAWSPPCNTPARSPRP